MAEVIDITKNKDQPKPKFTLLDLEAALGKVYEIVLRKQKSISDPNVDCSQAVGLLQELLAQVSIAKNNLEAIDMPVDNAKAITDTIETEKPELVVCGVQLFEYGKLQGTSLYTTVVKARKIRDVLNARFAELRVDHVAKIVNYPVY